MISTHILDTSKGTPAKDVLVTLNKLSGEGWTQISAERTNADGRIAFDCPKETGVYQLTFHIEDYYKGSEHFFLNTPVVFKINSTDRKYHVPLLINPYGYSTYRGS